MKITLNTHRTEAAASMMYRNALKSLPEVSLNDWNYSKYDVALIMTYDHESIKDIRNQYPNLKIGIVDPRSYKVKSSVNLCDFLIVDSIEMEDYWRVSNKPIFRYSEYPSIPYVKKEHCDKDKIIIGYHGNHVHLDCMSKNVTPALSELGKKYNIQLLVMNNRNAPSGKEKWYPKNCEVRFVPWSMDNYVKELAKSDIGISPNTLTHTTTPTKNSYNYSEDDYSLRFKMPSNPGRFFVFGKLNIPVVADFYPSSLQYLDGCNGFVAHNIAGGNIIWNN